MSIDYGTGKAIDRLADSRAESAKTDRLERTKQSDQLVKAIAGAVERLEAALFVIGDQIEEAKPQFIRTSSGKIINKAHIAAIEMQHYGSADGRCHVNAVMVGLTKEVETLVICNSTDHALQTIDNIWKTIAGPISIDLISEPDTNDGEDMNR